MPSFLFKLEGGWASHLGDYWKRPIITKAAHQGERKSEAVNSSIIERLKSKPKLSD
jgi:hypothetical protein